MGRRGYVPRRHLRGVPLRRRWVFHLRRRGAVLIGRHCYILLRRHHDVPRRRRGVVPLTRLGDVPPRRRWMFHLRPTCDVSGTYRETSLRCRRDVLLPGGNIPGEIFSLFNILLDLSLNYVQ